MSKKKIEELKDVQKSARPLNDKIIEACKQGITVGQKMLDDIKQSNVERNAKK